MDLASLNKKLTELIGTGCGASRFGHTQIPLVEVPSDKVIAVANLLRFEESLRMDWLEMMSAFERKGKIVLSYFIRSESHRTTQILRTELSPKHAHDKPSIHSVCEVWRMAIPFENEISEQFGIVFQGTPKNQGGVDRGLHFEEPPLRRTFVWESGLLS